MAISHIEEQFGTVKDLGSTYTLLGTVPVNHKWNVLLHFTNITGAPVQVQAFIASSSWAPGDGLPTGAKKIAAILYNTYVPDGDTVWDQGLILLAGQQLVVWSAVATALDIIACGVDINLVA